jgi:DNA-binding transcriptional regulator YiaG
MMATPTQLPASSDASTKIEFGWPMAPNLFAMTPPELRKARKRLGLTQHGLAEALRMGKSGWQSVSRWEQDGSTIPGPAQVAVECLLEHGNKS